MHPRRRLRRPLPRQQHRVAVRMLPPRLSLSPPRQRQALRGRRQRTRTRIMRHLLLLRQAWLRPRLQPQLRPLHPWRRLLLLVNRRLRTTSPRSLRPALRVLHTPRLPMLPCPPRRRQRRRRRLYLLLRTRDPRLLDERPRLLAMPPPRQARSRRLPRRQLRRRRRRRLAQGRQLQRRRLGLRCHHQQLRRWQQVQLPTALRSLRQQQRHRQAAGGLLRLAAARRAASQ